MHFIQLRLNFDYKIIIMKNLFLIILLCILPWMVNAQTAYSDYTNKVVTCETYDNYTGDPSGVAKSWTVSSTGSNVYVIYTSSNTIKEALSLDVKKRNAYSGKYEYYGSYYMSYDKNDQKKWAMYDLKFKEAGDYSLEVKNSKGKTLAENSTNITVDDEKMKKNEDSYSDSQDDDEVDTYYYENSKIQFGKDVNNGDIVDESSSFYLRGGKVSVAVLLTQDDAFKTDLIYVDLYDATSNKKIDSYTFDGIGKDWNWIKVQLDFTKRGKYFIDVYNSKDTFINTSETIEIK